MFLLYCVCFLCSSYAVLQHRLAALASTSLSTQSLQSPPTNRDLEVQLIVLRARLWGDDLVYGLRSSSLTEISEERFPMAHMLDVLLQLP
ncbi:hypothetical protein Plhal710r2_c005g0022231 [Plasmopara halstedii]